MSVAATNRNVEIIANLSRDIIELSTEIGEIKGSAETHGFPAYPVASKVDNGEVVLGRYIGADKVVRPMRDKIEKIYQYIRFRSSDCSRIANVEVRELVEHQIEALHEKRGLLEKSLRSFQFLLRSHDGLKLAESTRRKIEGELENNDECDFAEIRERIKSLECDVKLIFPLLKGIGPDFCKLHWEKKEELFCSIHRLRAKLNVKENKECEAVRSSVEHLVNKFEELRRSAGKPVAQVKIKQELFNAFQTLPIKFLEEISEQISFLSPEQKHVLTDMDNFTMQPHLHLVERSLKHALQQYPTYRPLSIAVAQEQAEEESDDEVIEQESSGVDKGAEISIAPSEAVNVMANEKEQTVITVKCQDVPSGQNIYIRGNGPGLNWEKGIPLIQIDWETWELQIANAEAEFEYKLVLNDESTRWEQGGNHKIAPGKKEVVQHGFSPSILPPLKKTIIEVEYPVPQGKSLYLSGNGPLGNWDKKIQMTRLGDHRWYLSFDGQFPAFEYKVRLGDAWECGGNHTAESDKRYRLSSLVF